METEEMHASGFSSSSFFFKDSKRVFQLKFDSGTSIYLDADNFLESSLEKSFSYFELLDHNETIHLNSYSYTTIFNFLSFVCNPNPIFELSNVYFEELINYFGANEKITKKVINPIRKIGATKIFSSRSLLEFIRIYNICFIKYGSDIDRDIAIQQQNIREYGKNIKLILQQLRIHNFSDDIYKFLCESLKGYNFDDFLLKIRPPITICDLPIPDIPWYIQKGNKFAKIYKDTKRNVFFICMNDIQYGRILLNELRKYFENKNDYESFSWIHPGFYKICIQFGQVLYLATTPCNSILQLYDIYDIPDSTMFRHDNVIYSKYKYIDTYTEHEYHIHEDVFEMGWPRDLPYIFWDPKSTQSVSKILQESNRYHDHILEFPNIFCGQICLPVVIYTGWVHYRRQNRTFGSIIDKEINSHLNMIALQFQTRFNGKINHNTSNLLDYRSRKKYKSLEFYNIQMKGMLWITIQNGILDVRLNHGFVASSREEYLNIRALENNE